MTATVRLDDTLEKTLDTLSKKLHKKKRVISYEMPLLFMLTI